MTTKISAKLRAAAIEALDLAACNATFKAELDGYGYTYGGEPEIDRAPYEEFGDCDSPTHRIGTVSWLMWQAWRMVLGVDRASLAEAACLLRDGWSPGEETVDLVHGDVTTDQPRTCKTWTKRELAVGDE